jgi:hypothetical protein
MLTSECWQDVSHSRLVLDAGAVHSDASLRMVPGALRAGGAPSPTYHVAPPNRIRTLPSMSLTSMWSRSHSSALMESQRVDGKSRQRVVSRLQPFPFYLMSDGSGGRTSSIAGDEASSGGLASNESCLDGVK